MLPSWPGGLVHALSFDIEDWFHIPGIAALEDPESWASLPSLVEPYTQEILQVCSDAGTRATFFVLGWVAERIPKLVAQIAAEGHELGTHSHWHRLVTDLDRAEFTADLRRSIVAIEDAAGAPVVGFRAPSFSIRPGTEWALEALLQNGLRFDASLLPVRRGDKRYHTTARPHLLELESGATIPELPISVLPLGALSTRFSGGGYLRLMPMPLIRWGIRTLATSGQPTVVYLHPRDFAHDIPTGSLPLSRKFKVKVGVKRTRHKLTSLLRDYNWSTCGEVLSPLATE